LRGDLEGDLEPLLSGLRDLERPRSTSSPPRGDSARSTSSDMAAHAEPATKNAQVRTDGDCTTNAR
jgi:hypothetical protein